MGCDLMELHFTDIWGGENKKDIISNKKERVYK